MVLGLVGGALAWALGAGLGNHSHQAFYIADGAVVGATGGAIYGPWVASHVGERIGALQGHPTVAITSAVILVGVPTLWALFPHLNATKAWERGCVFGAWVVVATVGAIAAQREKTEGAAHAQHERLMMEKLVLAVFLQDIPEPYRPSLYLQDPTTALLMPFFPDKVTDPSDVRVFRADQGVTGEAFSTGRAAATAGESVWTGFNLSLEQQKHYAGFRAVAAVPCRLRNETVVGALSVIATTNDGTFVSDATELNSAGIKTLEQCAERLGAVLPLLLGRSTIRL